MFKRIVAALEHIAANLSALVDEIRIIRQDQQALVEKAKNDAQNASLQVAKFAENITKQFIGGPKHGA
jgi:hypothetical protein